MKDFAASDDPRVQAQLDRLSKLSLPQGRLGLDTIRALLGRLGDPQKRLPPTFHVAIKPHLVRYNERIRIAGELITDELLATLLGEVLDASEGLDPSFFEITTAATFLAFARNPADACIIEVGLGGRFDATNVLEHPACCGIATLGIDHEAFLLVPEEGAPEAPLCRIAFEKAGIARPGSPLVTQAYPKDVELEIERRAGLAGAPLHMRGRDWWADVGEAIEYRDRFGELTLPLPSLPGRHQGDNAALAVAMLRHQDYVTAPVEAMAAGLRSARWPARLQLLGSGPLTALARGHAVWLDGGHNADAGQAIGRHFTGQKLHLVIGMLANRHPEAIIGPLEDRLLSVTAVPIEGSDSHGGLAYGPRARWAASLEEALGSLPADGSPVLIAGSLYLAGKALKANGELPD